MYTSKRNIFYVLDKKHEKYYNNYIKTAKKLKYADDNMKKEISRYFPIINMNFVSDNGEYVIVLDKTEDTVPLVQLVEAESIKAEHLAWILSRLSNIACYLDFYKLSHNGISINNCFISPEFHTIMLYGGWWYCVDQNEKMIGTEKDIFKTMPVIAKTKKVGSIETDLESIKSMSRTLSDITTPKDMKGWMNKGSSSKASNEFESWNKALDKTYGERKFVNWSLNIEKFYKK